MAAFGMTVALWPSVRATGFRFRWAAERGAQAVRTMARLATWVVVYVVANQLGYLVVLILAAEIQGGYTAYAAAFSACNCWISFSRAAGSCRVVTSASISCSETAEVGLAGACAAARGSGATRSRQAIRMNRPHPGPGRMGARRLSMARETNGPPLVCHMFSP